MIECQVNHPKLAGLFDPHIPNNPSLWSVFHGRLNGRAVVDNLQNPSQCLLRSEAVLTYSNRHVSGIFLETAIAYLLQAVPLWLIRTPGQPQAPKPHRISPRLEFYDVDWHSRALTGFRKSIPEGYVIHRIDRALLERCSWRDDMAFYCGNLDNFLHNGLGLCMMRGEEIIVEAYASALGGHYAEIGAITHAAHRGKGFAPIAVAYLIEALRLRGYHAYWSCDADNTASARVARKLGFKIENSYEIWEYEQNSS